MCKQLNGPVLKSLKPKQSGQKKKKNGRASKFNVFGMTYSIHVPFFLHLVEIIGTKNSISFWEK